VAVWLLTTMLTFAFWPLLVPNHGKRGWKLEHVFPEPHLMHPAATPSVYANSSMVIQSVPEDLQFFTRDVSSNITTSVPAEDLHFLSEKDLWSNITIHSISNCRSFWSVGKKKLTPLIQKDIYLDHSYP
jgi:hypothetical protein